MTERKKGKAEVVAERVIDRGRRMWRIVELRNLRELWELPVEYTTGTPMMYAEDTRMMYVRMEDPGVEEGKTKRFVVGGVYEEKEFDELMKCVMKCGKRLAEINERLKKENMNWVGTETFTI